MEQPHTNSRSDKKWTVENAPSANSPWSVKKVCNYHLQAAGLPLFEEHRIGSIEGLANVSVSTHLLTESSISTCVSQKLQCDRKGP